MQMREKSHVVKPLLGLMRPYTLQILLCVVLVMLFNGADLIKPWIMEIAVDDYLTPMIAGEPAQTGGFFLFQSLTGLGVSYFLVVVIGALASIFQSRLLARVCQSILNTMRLKLFDHIHRLKLTDLDEIGSGRLLTRATNDVEALNEFYNDVLIGLFRDIFLLIGIIVMMLNMNWRLALMAFTAVPLILIITFLCRGALHRNFVKMKALISRINGFIAESLSGIRVIQAFGREKEKYDQLHDLNLQYRKTTMTQVAINSFMRPVMEVVNALAIVLILLFGWHLAGQNIGAVEVGVLFAFTTYIKQFFEPINDLAEKYNSVQSAMVSADRIFSLLNDGRTLEDLDAPGHEAQIVGRVEFRDVWFAYVGEEWVLKGLSFTAEPGEKLAFVGATGAGKTTVINLLSRFYTPQRGQILIDGVPIEKWTLPCLRSQIAVVLQDVFLFAGTIADNVRVHADITDENIERALVLSHADEFVNRLGGIHAQVAERGATFSTGERQLISFARANAHQPAILVLDEATANIDSKTELLVQRSIESISQGRTAIFIAHRLSTIRNCDKIFVLDHGEVIESGSHEELMAKNGAYAKMVAGVEA